MVRAVEKFGGVHSLPPGQARFWADKAINGEADERVGQFYIFKNRPGAKEICITNLSPPEGYFKRK